MGDGFVLLQSSDIDIYYYQDEPGLYLCFLLCNKSDLSDAYCSAKQPLLT